MQYAWAAENRLALWLDGALDPTSPLGAVPLGFPAPKYAEALAAAGLAPWEQRRAMALSGPALPMPAAVGLRPPLAGPEEPEEEPPPLSTFGLRRGTVPTYSPYVQERWELVEYVNSTVLDDVAQPVWRESSAAGDLAVSATVKSAERATLSRRRCPRTFAGGATALWPPALPRAAAQGALDRGVVEVRGPDLHLQRRGALGVPGRDRPARDLPSAELREPDRHGDVLPAGRGQPLRGVGAPHDCPLSGSPSASAASASRSFMR